MPKDNKIKEEILANLQSSVNKIFTSHVLISYSPEQKLPIRIGLQFVPSFACTVDLIQPYLRECI